MAVARAAAEAGIGVSRPLSDVRYDFVFDFGRTLARVQCKWALRRGDVVMVRCRTCRRSRDGLVHGRYSGDEIDAFAGYCAEIDRCFYLPFAKFARAAAVQLRLAPARNNQRLRINWADDFDFSRLHLGALGP
jgi:hypothetical protein